MTVFMSHIFTYFLRSRFESNYAFITVKSTCVSWKMFFISSKKLFSFSRYSVFVIFPLPFHTFQILKDKWSAIIYVMNWLAYICRCNFWNNSKIALNYTMKLGQIIHSITNKEIFVNLFCNLKSNWSLAPDPFCFFNFVH